MSLKSYQRISPFFVSFSTTLFSARNASSSSLPHFGKLWPAPVLGCPLTANARDARGPDASLSSRHKCFLRRRRRIDSYNLPYSFSPEPRSHPSRVSVTHRVYHKTPDRGVRGLSCPFAQDRRALLRCELGLRAQCDVRFISQRFCHATSFLCPQNNTTCLRR